MTHKAIKRFEKAVRDHEFAGGAPPDDRPLIEAGYKDAKRELEKLLEVKKFDEEKLDALLLVYIKAFVKQEQWDAIAPVGLSTKQREKEQKIHAATETAYNALLEFLKS